jgi:hypothetical protein
LHEEIGGDVRNNLKLSPSDFGSLLALIGPYIGTGVGSLLASGDPSLP